MPTDEIKECMLIVLIGIAALAIAALVELPAWVADYGWSIANAMK